MDLQAAIDSIWQCRQQGIYYPPDWRGKLDVDAGYRVQLGILGCEVKGGQRHVGWKVGLTAKSIQQQVGHHERVFGYLLESGRVASGGTLHAEELVAPGFESELLVELGAPLKGPGVTDAQARAAISAVAPAIEIVEKRGDFVADIPQSLADNVQQRAFVVGPRTAPLDPAAVLQAATVEVCINGERVDEAPGSAVMGGPEASVAWLANRLAAFGWRLEKGQQIMTGSFTKQHPIGQGDLIEVRFAPYGAATVQFD